MSEKLRLFVAAEVPSLHRDWVGEQVASWRQELTNARWTEPRNQHLTLRFLGWTGEDDLPAIEEACAQVARSHRAAQVRLSAPGAFPTPRRARVLWIGIDDPAGLLTALAGDLDRALEPLGFASEERAFTPHLTLARLKVPARVELPELDATQIGPFDIDSIGLWRSHLARTGAEYELLNRWELNA